MSSVFLYVAIVAIWAFVLVPRWLRRHHAQPQEDADDAYVTDSQDEAEESDDYAADRADGGARSGRPMTAYPAQAPPRSRMLQARRRLLTTLMVLATVVGACAAIRVVPWWACAPPAGVLCVYVLLLREAARADAEQARRQAAAQAHAASRLAAATARAHAVASAQPSAEIIDISERVADQLYDQYTDATVRAVGD